MSNQLKHTILTLQDYLKELIRKWYWYIIVGLIFGGLMYYVKKDDQSTYLAKASFMTDSDAGGGGSSFLQLAGQFGFGGNSEVSSEKIVELLTTKRIIYNTLLQTGNLEGRADLLINHYLNLFKTDERLTDYPEVKGFRFAPKVMEAFDFNENLLASNIYRLILKENLRANASNNGIVRINFTSKSEEYAQQFTEKLVETLRSYYVDQSVEKQEQTLKIVSEKVDSLQSAMKGADSELTAWYQRNEQKMRAQSVPPASYMKKIELERNAEIASNAYVEALKNEEVAKLNIANQTPLIQVIDFPTLPLQKNTPSLLVSLVIALFLSFIVTTLLIILNKLIKDALKS